MEFDLGPHPDRPLDPPEALGFAADRVPEAPAGVGAVVVGHQVREDGHHDWTVLINDGRHWAHVHAIGTDFERWERPDPVRIARLVEEAAPRRVPPEYRVETMKHAGPVRVSKAMVNPAAAARRR